jgi:DNA-binding transcriptional ArsR family regulator
LEVPTSLWGGYFRVKGLTRLGELYNHMVMTVTASATMTESELDRAFGALSDPTRRAILSRLAEGDAGVMDVAAPFPISQPAITKHLNVLEEAGLISRHRQARQRLCHLEPVRLKQLSDWVGSYREFWEESFGRLDELLEELQRTKEADTQNKTEGGAT